METILRIKHIIFPYLEELRNFYFSIANPLFWVFLFILFLFLLRFWKIKKSFSFSLVLAFILLGSTKVEAWLLSIGIDREGFGIPLLRAFTFLIIGIVFVYYVFVRGE